MKRFLLSVVLATTLAFTSCQFDDSDIWEKFGELEETIRDHEQRITALEELCKQMNTNIEALQTIVEALQNNDYVTSVVPVTKDGKVIGYTITFTKSQPITIYHGEDGADGADGKDGKDGYTPQIGVKQDNDGIYYWTIDGEWLYDADGNKVKAVGVDGKDGADGKDGVNGTDGEDGADGKDGVNGTDGKDGITPRLKIENGYWYISYDNEVTWIQLGKATGENGKDGVNGTNGTNGDSFFLNVTQDENCVYFTLADGTVITLPKYKAEAEKSNEKIYYTTSDGQKISPKNASSMAGTTGFGASLISNTYKNGQGVLIFDNTITSIGAYAFKDCTSLTSVTIPDSVTLINIEAFNGCSSLTSVTIPDSVTSIGKYAFTGCTGELIVNCNIPSETYGAFYNSKFTKITIGNNVTSIGSSAFNNCTLLTSVTIPDSVTSIGSSAFNNCTSLTSVTIPDSVTSIGPSAFNNCTSLTSVYYTGDLSAWCKISLTSISANPLNNGAKLYLNGVEATDITIPSDITEIKSYTFNGCSSLTSITIPDSVTRIGHYAFTDCTGELIVNCNIIPSASAYNYGAFYNSKFTKVTIGDSVTLIGSYAFYNCKSLTSVTIPDSVTSIGNSAFYNCTSLTEVYCKPTTSPTGASDMFKNNASSRMIYVPTASVEAYKAASYWSNYADYIVGYDF